MKNRDYKLWHEGGVFHIYNRGNRKEPIFRSKQDYEQCLFRMKLLLGKQDMLNIKLALTPFPVKSFSVYAYCLMPNHFHLLLRQNGEVPVSKFLQSWFTSYSMYFNNKYNLVGHLFQNKPQAKLVSMDSYLLWVSAYIHRNHKFYQQFPYSSYLDYIGARNGTIPDTKTILGYCQNDKAFYKKFVESLDERQLSAIQEKDGPFLG